MDEYITKAKARQIVLKHGGAGAAPALLEIDREPAADVVPVVRGYWHGEGDGYADGELVYDMWQCSCCGKWFDEWDDKPTWSFCPRCGADMRGGDSQ